MRSRWARPGHALPREARDAGGERGAVTAELAAVLPAVVFVLALCLGAVQVVGTQLRLTDAAADAARTLARGDDIGVAAGRADTAVPGGALAVSRAGDFVCASVTAAAGGAFSALELSARSCALDGGL